jgi:hypothetical protein
MSLYIYFLVKINNYVIRPEKHKQLLPTTFHKGLGTLLPTSRMLTSAYIATSPVG